MRHFFGRSNRYDLWRKIPPPVLDHLAQRDWPGNVRQLRNLVRRLVISGGKNVDSVEAVSREYAAGEIPAAGDDSEQR
jgi:DNA-binding NtrC family response regulator